MGEDCRGGSSRFVVMARAAFNGLALGAGLAGGGYFYLNQELRREHGAIASELNRVGGWDLPSSLSPAPESKAWDAKVKADFAKTWNSGIDVIYGQTVKTSDTVKGLMPFHFADVKSWGDSQMRGIGSLVDSTQAQMTSAMTDAQSQVSSATGL